MTENYLYLGAFALLRTDRSFLRSAALGPLRGLGSAGWAAATACPAPAIDPLAMAPAGGGW